MSNELTRLRDLRQKLNKALAPTGGSGMPALAACLLNAAVTAHMHHFAVTGVGSDAAHRALADLYDGLPDLVDGLVESYQGKFGLMPAPAGTPLEFVRGLQAEVASLRATIPQDSELQNEVDTIANLINRTAYRLQHLQ